MSKKIDLLKITQGLVEAEDGIWYPGTSEAVSYPEQGNAECFEIEDNSFWFRHRNKCIASLVEHYCKKSEPFVDIGGGNGIVSAALSKQGFPTILVEPGSVGAHNAKERGLEHVICSTLENAGFLPATISAVGMFDVIEHLHDDATFVETIKRYVAPKGHIFATVPAYNFLWSEEDRKAGHFKRYTTATLSSLMERAGIEVLYSSYFFRYLPLPILLTRTIPYLLGLTRGKEIAGTTAREHIVKNNALSRLVDALFLPEIESMRRLKPISFGGSCIVVGRKL